MTLPNRILGWLEVSGRVVRSVQSKSVCELPRTLTVSRSHLGVSVNLMLYRL